MARYDYRGDGPVLPDLATISPRDLDPEACQRMWGQVLLASMREEFAGLRQARAAGRPYRIRWIGTDDYHEVCGHAGIDPDRVTDWVRQELRKQVPGASLTVRGAAGHYVSSVRSGPRATT